MFRRTSSLLVNFDRAFIQVVEPDVPTENFLTSSEPFRFITGIGVRHPLSNVSPECILDSNGVRKMIQMS